MNSLIPIFLILLLHSPALSQRPPQRPPSSSSPRTDLESILTVSFGPSGTTSPAGDALYPSRTFAYETPIQVRYAFLIATADYQVSAACHPTALSFLAIRHVIPERLCTSLQTAIIRSYADYRAIRIDFPDEARGFANYLQDAGLDPFNDSTDLSTAIGWGNLLGDEVANYAKNDGWNSLGDATRQNNRLSFQDSTNYLPVNHADLRPFRLIKPLRWQPLTQSKDGRGSFISQRHVTPHIGLTGTPLVLSRSEFRSKKVSSPYKHPNKLNTLSRPDRRAVQAYIDDVFTISRNLTRTQRAQASYWNNKFISLGAFTPVYSAILRLDDFTQQRLFLGDMLAQHDAILLAWKEKRRHDLARPSTLISRLRTGTERLFVPDDQTVRDVDVADWEPLLRTQPHSEFPSASATLCTAALEHLEFGLRELLGGDVLIPPFTGVLSTAFSEFEEEVLFSFRTIGEAARNCGQSRLFGGVHFPPAVDAGEELARGVGRAAFEHVRELVEGRVPRNCARCRGG